MKTFFAILFAFVAFDASCQPRHLSGSFSFGCIDDGFCPVYKFVNDSVYFQTSNFNLGKTKWEQGKYRIYYDTMLVLYSNNETIMSPKDSLFFYRSKYSVRGDSIIFGLFTHRKFCNYSLVVNSDSSWSINGCSGRNYEDSPLSYSDNSQVKSDIENVIQAVIDYKDLQKYYDTSQFKLIIQNYQFINGSYGISINKFGVKADFLTKEEVKNKNIKNYIVFNSIKFYSPERALVNLKVNNSEDLNLIMIQKINGKWTIPEGELEN